MILGKSVLEIFKSSYTMQLLLLTSIFALALIMERIFYFLRMRLNVDDISEKFKGAISNNEMEIFLTEFKNKRHPVYKILKTLFYNRSLDENGLYDLLDAQIIKESKSVRANIIGLSTIAAIAPLLGLYGTVVGLIKAFYNIVLTGSGGPEVVAGGIAEALLTTAFGLIIAIPTLIFHNYFAKKADDILESSEAIGKEFIAYIKKSNLS